jgi:hypothetical protein
MNNQSQKLPPPTMSLGSGRQICQDPLMAGLNDEQKRWVDLLAGERDLVLLCAVSRSPHPSDQEILADWKNLWLIEHQDSLWIYGFTQEEKQQIFEHLKQLRSAGYYLPAFVRFEEHRAREEWGC